jgi:hypothetical protein
MLLKVAGQRLIWKIRQHHRHLKKKTTQQRLREALQQMIKWLK